MIQKVLFVCTGNLCRSPMAAAVFADRARASGRGVEVDSAGIAACVGQPPPEPVIALMQVRGLDVADHRAQQLSLEIATGSDLVLVMETEQQRYIEKTWLGLKGRVRRLGDWRGTDIFDPYRQSRETYAACLEHIDDCLSDWQGRLLA